MKITQINNTRGIIIKSSIKKVIIDGDVENASAFKDVVITHLSTDTLNIIASNSSPYRRINVSYDLMLLLQKLWRNNLIAKPKVMPKFRILPTGYPSVLGLEFRITPYDSDDGLTGSMAIMIEDMNTSEKLGYIPNFITQGQYRNRIKKWKRQFRDEHLTELILFNNNAGNGLKNVEYNEKSYMTDVVDHLNSQDDAWINAQLLPYNPIRLLKINEVANENNHRIVWLPSFAKFLHYYDPDQDFAYQAELVDDTNKSYVENHHHFTAIYANQIDDLMIIQQANDLPVVQQLDQMATTFKQVLPQTDLTEIVKLIAAQETYSI